MPTLTFRELAEMVHGEVLQNPDIKISSVVIDSREVKPDSVFFAIKGDRLDGHQFIPQALQTARGAVVAHVPDAIPRDKGIVRVADTTKALQDLAQSIRKRYKFLLIAITGSATLRLLELPSGMVGSPLASIFRSARSVSGSLPTSLAEKLRPSDSVTSIDEAPSTT